jgi:hypothetical protein
MTNKSAKVIVPYSSVFAEREASEDEIEVFSDSGLIEDTLPPDTENPHSDIYLLRHLFGPENELIFKVNGKGPQRDFKLDGSEETWELERDLDIAERGDYRWRPKSAVRIAVVGVMAAPDRNSYEENRRIDQVIIEVTDSPTPPSAVILHGPRVQFAWKLDDKVTRKQLDDFETRFHEKFKTVPSDLTLFEITTGLRDLHQHKPGSVYLSDAVYHPRDLRNMYSEAKAPPVSGPRVGLPAWRQRIEKAYDLLPHEGVLSAIGHILAHQREVKQNVDPILSMAWQRYPDGGGAAGLYLSYSANIKNGALATRHSGDGPERAVIIKGFPVDETSARFLDVQTNIVRDMHRQLPKKVFFWLHRTVHRLNDEPLKTVAAVMLAAGMSRKDGVEVMALCHGALFAKDIKLGEQIPDDINDRIGIISTKEQMEARLKAATEAFDAIPDVGTDLPDPARMPIDIFDEIRVPRLEENMVPPVLWRFAESNARQIGAAVEAIFISSLFACAAAISDDVRIKPRSNSNWLESARIWAALIAPPSAKKSPAASVALKPLQAIDRQRVGAATEKLATYELNKKIYKAQEAAYIKAAAKGDDAGDPPVPPQEPLAERLLIMDATPEALVNIAMNQTRGLALYRDELSGWFGSFDAYKGGGKGSKDGPFWLSAYNGDGWIVDRVSRSGGSATNVGTSIFGGIQHDALRDLKLHQKRDGMLARFLPVILDKRDGNVGQNVEADSHANNIYELLIERLAKLAPRRLDGTECGPIECPDNISEQMDDFLRELALLSQTDGAVPDAMAEHLGKLEGMAYRLLLIYHCIDISDPWATSPSQKLCDRVLRLLRGFVLPSIDVLYNQLLATEVNNHTLALTQKVARTILAKRLTKFDLRQLQQSNSSWFPKADIEGNRMRYMILNLLRDANWIDPVGLDHEADHTVFKPHTKWKTNPLVWETMEEQQKDAESARKQGWELLKRNIANRKGGEE